MSHELGHRVKEDKGVLLLVVEELDHLLVEPEGKGLDETHIVSEELVVPPIVRVRDEGVHVIVGEKVEHGLVVREVLGQDRQVLDQLNRELRRAVLLPIWKNKNKK